MQIQVAAEHETMVSGAVFQVTSDLQGSTRDFCNRHESSSQVHCNKMVIKVKPSKNKKTKALDRGPSGLVEKFSGLNHAILWGFGGVKKF